MNNKYSNCHIIIFTQSLAAGGAEKQSVLLAKALKEEFYDVRIILYYNIIDSKLNEIIKKNNIQIFILQGLGLLKIAKLFFYIRKTKPFLIFNYLLLPSFIGGLCARLNGIFSIGGIRNAVLDKRKVRLNRFCQNYMNNLTIYNNYTGFKNYSSNGFKKSKAIVIPNAIEIKNSLIIRQNNKCPIIISVGRFEKQKNYQHAIQIIKLLKESGLIFKYWLIGWGKLEIEIKELVHNQGIADICEIIINPKNLENYYINADIYLQTSLFEGLSNTVMEAMSYSLPLVVTDVGDNNQLVIDGKSGFILPVKDMNSIVDRLEQLVLSKELRNEMGICGYEHLKNNYSLERFKERYMDLIQKLINEKKT